MPRISIPVTFWNFIFNSFQFLSFVAFTVTSAIISVNMFVSFSENEYEKLLLLIIALAIEIFKVFLIIQGNTFYVLKKKKQAYIRYALYGLSVSMSIIASYGFNNTIIARSQLVFTQTPSAIELQANQKIIESLNERISELTNRIQAQEERLKVIPETFTTQLREVNRLIAQYGRQKEDLQKQVLELANRNILLEQEVIKEQTQIRSTANMFTLMVESFRNTFLEPIKENMLKMTLLMIIAVIIEIGILITAPAMPIDKDLDSPSEQKEPPIEPQLKKRNYTRRGRKKENTVQTQNNFVEAANNELNISQNQNKNELENEQNKPSDFALSNLESSSNSHLEPPVINIKSNFGIRPVKEIKEVEEDIYLTKKVRYRAGVLTDEQKQFFIKFIHGLFGEHSPAELEDPNDVAIAQNIPISYIQPFVQRLTSIHGRTGYPMIEKNFQTGKYKANYSKDYILQYLFEEI